MFFKYSLFLETDPEHYVDKGWARKAGQFSFCAQRRTCALHLVNPEAPGWLGHAPGQQCGPCLLLHVPLWRLTYQTHLRWLVQQSVLGASLVVQWLRIRLPMQRTWVQSLVQEGPPRRGASKLMSRSYWAPCPGAWAAQEQPPQEGAATAQPEVSPARHRENPRAATRAQGSRRETTEGLLKMKNYCQLQYTMSPPSYLSLFPLKLHVHPSNVWKRKCQSLSCVQLEWVAIPFFWAYSQPREQTQVSCVAGRFFTVCCCSVTQLCLTLRPHGLQHARLSCPSPSPRVYLNLCPLSWWCHPTISSSVIPFSSCPQHFPATGSFQMSRLFASRGQSIGVSASTSVIQMNTQDWSPLGWTGWISLQSKGLPTVFSKTTVQKHQFFSAQLSLWSDSCLSHYQLFCGYQICARDWSPTADAIKRQNSCLSLRPDDPLAPLLYLVPRP